MRSKKTGLIILVVLLALLAVASAVYIRFGGLGTGKSADPKEFARYAVSVDELTIPTGVRIVALGEATHGNAEFQQLKLDVFRLLVERFGIRAFALEGDYGSCEAVNRYIHGGPGTPAEAAAAISFTIYRTQQMEQLIAWMRQYNEAADDGEDIRFYGFDMQQIDWNIHILTEAANNLEIDIPILLKQRENMKDEVPEKFDIGEWIESIEQVKQELLQFEGTEVAVHCADILLQNCSLGKVMSTPNVDAFRDSLMAKNVQWILEREESLGRHSIFISAHNGHIKRVNDYRNGGKGMGHLLANRFGKAYYAIGTDFYRSCCNLPKNPNRTQRANHTFFSCDPLAKAAKHCGFETCWLDFAKVPDGSSLQRYLNNPINMGSLGEVNYSFLMRVLPRTFRSKGTPRLLYNSMIFVPVAHPTAPNVE